MENINLFYIIKHLENCWVSSKIPTFLIKSILKNNYFLSKLSDLIVSKKIVDSFDRENFNLRNLIYNKN